MRLAPTRCWLLSILALAWLGGCSAQDREPEAPGEPGVTLAAPLDAAAWIERVRSAHATADAEIEAGQLERALARLRGAIELGAPPAVHPDHGRVTLQDLWFRVAQLELRRSRPERALTAADQGLLLGRARDVFTANLLIARGEALEALHRDTEAAASYYDALEVNAALLRSALRSSDAGAP